MAHAFPGQSWRKQKVPLLGLTPPALAQCPVHSHHHPGGGFPSAGKSHLLKAITLHEESVREASLCKKLRNIEVLQEVLSVAHQRSRLKYAQYQEDDDLLTLIEAPDIICE